MAASGTKCKHIIYNYILFNSTRATSYNKHISAAVAESRLIICQPTYFVILVEVNDSTLHLPLKLVLECPCSNLVLSNRTRRESSWRAAMRILSYEAPYRRGPWLEILIVVSVMFFSMVKILRGHVATIWKS